MISLEPIDGVSFKLTLTYTDYEEAEPFEPYIRYSDDLDELIQHVKDVIYEMNQEGKYMIEFKIQDDSK